MKFMEDLTNLFAMMGLVKSEIRLLLFNSETKQRKAFGLLVMALMGIPASHVTVPGSGPGFPVNSIFP